MYKFQKCIDKQKLLCYISNCMNSGVFVISRAGHDKGECYVITTAVDENFVLVCNGGNRPIAKPKRKNIRHLFVTKTKCAAATDLEIKRSIKEFQKKGEA